MLDKFSRYQANLNFADIYPAIVNHCACGCGKELTGRKQKWASRECNNNAYQLFSIIKGNGGAIRKALFEIDKGFCRNCGAYDKHWQADHIVAVVNGGGGCDISNLQTLCNSCHKDKTKIDLKDK